MTDASCRPATVLALTLLVLLLSPASYSDPHYVQVLQPYLSQEEYRNYLDTFDESLSVVIDSTPIDEDIGMEGEMYIYIYRINQPNIYKFTLTNCPTTSEAPFIVDLMPQSSEPNPLQAELYREPKQVAYFYSTNPPAEISYYLNDDAANAAVIMGPACPDRPEPLDKEDLYEGPEVEGQPWYINGLLSYRELYVDHNSDSLNMHIYYREDVDAETFTVAPLWMGKYFSPAAGTNEKVSIPISNMPVTVFISVYTNRATGPKLKWQPHDDFRDTDVLHVDPL